MKINKFVSFEKQEVHLGKNTWSVARLITLSKNFLVMDVPLDHLNVYSTYSNLTLRGMVMHIKAVNNADLSYPIILDEDGDIMDGRHRIMRALLENKETIKAVRFDENPVPCTINEV